MMGTRFEQFMQDHRNAFDTEEPGEQVWRKLQQQLEPPKKHHTALMMRLVTWCAAAAILVLAGMGVYSLFINKPSAQSDNIAMVQEDKILKEINPGYAEEVYHFTKLIELKQTELKKIEKDHPRLYKKFVSDITRLDSSYNALRKELPANPNREQLLEAMIENLRLQTEILNQQLNIIKQINENNHDDNSKDI
jgi:hypothetical protein